MLVLNLLLVCACSPAATSPTSSSGRQPSLSPNGSVEPSLEADGSTLTGTIDAGEVAGSATVDPFEAAVIEATGPDGSTYRLAIEAASVRHPTLVSLRPLTAAAFDGATLLAGVEIEPSGLQLFIPAVLTIVPATHGDVVMPTALEYTGTSAASSARIAAVTSSSSASGYELILTHFSGGILAGLTPDTETSIFEAISAAHSLPNTPEGRQGRAETGLRTVKWAEDRGRMDHETATRRTADYEREWWEAEADRVHSDPALQQEIAAGDPADFDAINTEVARMLEAAKRVQDSGTDASAMQTDAFEVISQYGQNVVEHLKSDPEFQTKLSSGLLSDYDDVITNLGLVAQLGRAAAVMGDEATGQALTAAFSAFLQTFGVSVGASCSQAPIPLQMTLTLTRMAALLGVDAAATALGNCIPTPPPCPQALRSAQEVTLAAFMPGRPAADSGQCVGLHLTGTLTFKKTLVSNEDSDFFDVSESATTTIEVRLLLFQRLPAGLTFEDDGSTLTYSEEYVGPPAAPDGQCVSSGHGAAAGSFAANNGSIAGYTTGTEGSMQTAGLYYWFDYAGTTQSGGCGPDADFTGRKVDRLGCSSEDVLGSAIASSPAGQVFDFGCTNNEYIDPADGSTWLIENSGTLVLGP